MKLSESLDYLDMKEQVIPILGIDQYESTIGDDADIIVLDFSVRAKLVADDLVKWMEHGYEWVIDADTSPGAVSRNRYLVFVEFNRRNSAPIRIIEILKDLYTLTGIKLSEWQIKIEGKRMPATEENIRRNMPLDAVAYKQKDQGQLNEWRQMAGLKLSKIYESDEEIQQLQRAARII